MELGMTEDNTQTFKAVYVSFPMIINVAERMRTEGIPARVDRSYLGTASGTTKAQYLAAAKGLGFLDGDLKPTEIYQTFVNEPDQRPAITRTLLDSFYAPALALGTNATQQQLDEVFREEYGISGSTVRKAIAFYLAAAKFAGVDLSPHFTVPRTTAPSTGARRRRTTKSEQEHLTVTVDPMSALKTKYVETLLEKFAGSNGDVDPALADRIERLVGFQAPATEPE
jgi:hypothetical protein